MGFEKKHKSTLHVLKLILNSCLGSINIGIFLGILNLTICNIEQVYSGIEYEKKNCERENNYLKNNYERDIKYIIL